MTARHLGLGVMDAAWCRAASAAAGVTVDGDIDADAAYRAAMAAVHARGAIETALARAG